jgi:hypothetical protein
MSLRLIVCAIRRWWEDLFLPPRPSDFYVLFLKEYGMSHMKKATVVLPGLRPDEQKFSDEVSAILSRRLSYNIDGGEEFVVDVPLTQPTIDIGEVPANSIISIGIANVDTDGHVSEYNVREVQAPPPTHAVPVPDAVTVTFEDVEDET